MVVKVKKVELIELFYDLIFVYAISRLTSLISEPVNGAIPLNSLFVYIITSFVILQAWLYFTNYVNRYGQWKWYEYLIACINMIAVIYMTNTINTSWTDMYLPFNISMLIMLLTVLSLYLVHVYREKTLKCAAGNSVTILSVVCFYLCTCIDCNLSQLLFNRYLVRCGCSFYWSILAFLLKRGL